MRKQLSLIPFDEQAAQKLVDTLSISPILAQLLCQREITEAKAARQFLAPQLSDLHDPFLMLDMAEAVNRLAQAVDGKEKILLYGDYDVDGTTAIALMYAFLESQHALLDFYIPDRYKEGYGVSAQGIQYAKDTNARLLITLDCGIRAVEQIAAAKAAGMDTLICDHHLAGAHLPPALAVLDPKRANCAYPFKELSGCAIAFKLVQAYCKQRGLPDSQWKSLLDLVVVSQASDIVPLQGENRTLATFGLRQLNQHARLGLTALVRQSGRSYPLTISDIVFGIGPMINAAGRLADADAAVHLLLAADKSLAFEQAEALDRRNRLRKEVDRVVEQEAEAILQTATMQTPHSIVLSKADWHKGVLGIVASRLAERHHKPTILLSGSAGELIGSARSAAGVDVHQALTKCADLLTSFGGHRFAAGLKLQSERLAPFAERFDQLVSEAVPPESREPHIELSARLKLANIRSSLWKDLQQLQPFGPGNRRPVFLSRGVYDTGHSRVLKGEHLRLELEEAGSTGISAIAFSQADRYALLQKGPIDICYTIEQNRWQGRTRLQLNVKDIRESRGLDEGGETM